MTQEKVRDVIQEKVTSMANDPSVFQQECPQCLSSNVEVDNEKLTMHNKVFILLVKPGIVKSPLHHELRNFYLDIGGKRIHYRLVAVSLFHPIHHHHDIHIIKQTGDSDKKYLYYSQHNHPNEFERFERSEGNSSLHYISSDDSMKIMLTGEMFFCVVDRIEIDPIMKKRLFSDQCSNSTTPEKSSAKRQKI